MNTSKSYRLHFSSYYFHPIHSFFSFSYKSAIETYHSYTYNLHSNLSINKHKHTQLTAMSYNKKNACIYEAEDTRIM